MGCGGRELKGIEKTENMKEDDDSDEKKPEKDDSDELPEKMIKLLSFFDDLSTDFGRFCIMEKVKKW